MGVALFGYAFVFSLLIESLHLGQSLFGMADYNSSFRVWLLSWSIIALILTTNWLHIRDKFQLLRGRHPLLPIVVIVFAAGFTSPMFYSTPAEHAQDLITEKQEVEQEREAEEKAREDRDVESNEEREAAERKKETEAENAPLVDETGDLVADNCDPDERRLADKFTETLDDDFLPIIPQLQEAARYGSPELPYLCAEVGVGRNAGASPVQLSQRFLGFIPSRRCRKAVVAYAARIQSDIEEYCK